jgi:hypothetical protein
MKRKGGESEREGRKSIDELSPNLDHKALQERRNILCRSIMRPESRRAVGLALPWPALEEAERKRQNGGNVSKSTSENENGRKKDRNGHVRSRSVNGLEDGSVSTDVSGRSQTETTDETGAHVGKDVTVKVRGDEDGVGERSWVLDDLFDRCRTGGEEQERQMAGRSGEGQYRPIGRMKGSAS